MAFITDKEELKPGLVIFRRQDVAHRNWYCRVKLPREDRYKTISLKTPDAATARDRAFDHDADIRFRLKHDVPVFNRPFSQVAEEYAAMQEHRAALGEITPYRVQAIKSTIKSQLNPYIGSIQIHLIGHDRWDNYPSWRRAAAPGRLRRAGQTRPLTEEELKVAKEEAAAKAAKIALRKGKRGAAAKVEPPEVKTEWYFASDSTISGEMAVFSAIMSFAASKRYIPVANKFGPRPKLRTERRDEFTREEYRALHSRARKWIKEARTDAAAWRRTIVYNFVLIMCGTGMRPPEAKNLRWRDVAYAKDREGREVVVLSVHGKGKSRRLVAPAEGVGAYIERVRELSVATNPDDRVFTTKKGAPTRTLFKRPIVELLKYAKLSIGPSGTPRSTYCFRHTYATLRLSEGVDAYLLAEQMGTSVQMIQQHYGHVNTVKHADLVLQGMGNWDPTEEEEEDEPDEQAVAAPVIASAKAANASRATPKQAKNKSLSRTKRRK